MPLVRTAGFLPRVRESAADEPAGLEPARVSCGATYLVAEVPGRAALSFFAWRFSFSDLLAGVLELFEPPLSLLAIDASSGVTVSPSSIGPDDLRRPMAPIMPGLSEGRTEYHAGMMEFFRTELGKTLRIEETDEGALRVEILKEGVWQSAPHGMIGLRVAHSTHRLTAAEVLALPL